MQSGVLPQVEPQSTVSCEAAVARRFLQYISRAWATLVCAFSHLKMDPLFEPMVITRLGYTNFGQNKPGLLELLECDKDKMAKYSLG